jgi:signal transduction histidine kinase
MDKSTERFIKQIKQLGAGIYDPHALTEAENGLGQAIRSLARDLELRQRQEQQFDQIMAQINAGLTLEDALNAVYQSFWELIPYDRIGVALLEEGEPTVRLHWVRSDLRAMKLEVGYTAPLAGSSLELILQSGQPRILNDLQDYLQHKPESISTRLIVEEGLHSSLTCPLIVEGIPQGFIFFSCAQPQAYTDAHCDVFQRIARQLAVVVEKGLLVSRLAAQKEAIERQNKELRRLNGLKNAFVGMAVHDLRDPIAHIQMVAQVLLGEYPPLTVEEQREFLRTVGRQADHMLQMIGEILDVTEIEAGRLNLQIATVDLCRLLDVAVTHYNHLASAKGTHVLLEAAPIGLVQVDPMRVRQVIDNLISNAVKFSPPGSKVHVSAAKIEAGWKVSIRDEGPGVTAEDRKRLFQDFARLSARPTGGEKSTGLGLAISKRFVEAHGGQIGVDSSPGQGATFWFTLPDSAE